MATRTITIIKRSLLVLGAIAAAAIAAPAQDRQPDRGLHNRASTTAPEQASATCVAGAPAGTTSAYRVDYAAVAAPDTTGSYDIDESFRAAHNVGSVTSISFSPGSDVSDVTKDYASFKCQYTCNSTPGCVSFFGRFVQANSTGDQFECMSFDALLDQSAFTLKSQNVAVEGFNKFCR